MTKTLPDSANELRLQALLRKMDKFDDEDDATSADVSEYCEYLGPRRGWSDDAPDAAWMWQQQVCE